MILIYLADALRELENKYLNKTQQQQSFKMSEQIPISQQNNTADNNTMTLDQQQQQLPPPQEKGKQQQSPQQQQQKSSGIQELIKKLTTDEEKKNFQTRLSTLKKDELESLFEDMKQDIEHSGRQLVDQDTEFVDTFLNVKRLIDIRKKDLSQYVESLNLPSQEASAFKNMLQDKEARPIAQLVECSFQRFNETQRDNQELKARLRKLEEENTNYLNQIEQSTKKQRLLDDIKPSSSSTQQKLFQSNPFTTESPSEQYKQGGSIEENTKKMYNLYHMVNRVNEEPIQKTNLSNTKLTQFVNHDITRMLTVDENVKNQYDEMKRYMRQHMSSNI